MTYRKIGFLLVAAGILLITTAISRYPGFRLIISLPDALGFREPKKYLVLLQNNTELRPTGGFMGTFALVTLDRGRPSIRVEDIYAPDGQVKGHVDPPSPIQEAFQLGEWRLRDANWDPDFPSSSQTVEWFMEKGGVSGIDGTISTNLIVFEEVLKVLGPIELPDYKEIVTAENLWLLGEQYSQDSFFPGSIQKREFFSDLAQETTRSLQDSSMKKRVQLAKTLFRLLEEKQIMVSFADQNAQRAIESFNWAGQLRLVTCPWYRPHCAPLSLMIVEANLGVNKANCCIDRSARLTIEVPGTSMEVPGTSIRYNLSLIFTNRSSKETWGGRYKAWIRIYANAEEQTGFWVDVPEGETREYSTEFSILYPSDPSNPPHPSSSLLLLIQKQSGITEFPLTIRIERGDRDRKKIKEVKTVIRKDETFVL